jgi:multisubunit Na+/H+ antiporter MnhB subunit
LSRCLDDDADDRATGVHYSLLVAQHQTPAKKPNLAARILVLLLFAGAGIAIASFAIGAENLSLSEKTVMVLLAAFFASLGTAIAFVAHQRPIFGVGLALLGVAGIVAAVVPETIMAYRSGFFTGEFVPGWAPRSQTAARVLGAVVAILGLGAAADQIIKWRKQRAAAQPAWFGPGAEPGQHGHGAHGYARPELRFQQAPLDWQAPRTGTAPGPFDSPTGPDDARPAAF